MTLKKQVLSQLKECCEKPIPRWRFVLRGVLLYFVLVTLFLVTSLLISLAFYYLTVNDWDLYAQVSVPLMHKVFSTVPFFIFGFVAVLSYLLYVDVRKQGRGYRFCTWRVITGIVIAVFVSGAVLHVLDGGYRLDRYTINHHPGIAKIINPRLRQLSNPERGVMVGQVASDLVGNTFFIDNPYDGRWLIVLPNTSTKYTQYVQVGNHIKCAGSVTKPQVFEATYIMPFHKQLPKEKPPLEVYVK